MTVAVIPDAEKLTRDFLVQHDAVEALGTRIVGDTPSSVSASWVRLTQINAPSDPTSTVDHLVPFFFQLDCYSSKEGIGGSPQKEASLIGRTIRAALQEMPDSSHTGAVVSRVRITRDSRQPDTDLEPARERRILSALVYMHAA